MWQSSEQSRLAAVMYVRGFSVLALGAIAIRWPQSFLWIAIGLAGAIVTLLGIVEITLAARSPADRAVTSLLRYVAMVSIAFGLVSFAAILATPAIAVAALSTWLLAQATVSVMVGAGVKRPADRRALLTWAGINLVAAVMVAVLSTDTFYGLLYAGAGYTALYGVVQIVAGLRLRAEALSVLAGAPIR